MHQPTIEKLHDLRLGAMANALTAQLQQPEIDAMPFAERLALLVDIQHSAMLTAAYVERLLTGRDHIEQGVRSCLGILRLATRYPGEQLEAACVRAMSAGASSSGFVEHLLKSGRPLVDPVAEDGVGHHGNIRGPGYYH